MTASLDAIWPAGLLLAAGYAARWGQNVFTWWRLGLVDDRNRWRNARMDFYRELVDLAQDIITLAQQQRSAAGGVYTDPRALVGGLGFVGTGPVSVKPGPGAGSRGSGAGSGSSGRSRPGAGSVRGPE